MRMLAALDDEAAATLLRRGASRRRRAARRVQVDLLTAGQDWAIRTRAWHAGLALSPDGAVVHAREVGPLRPYLPTRRLPLGRETQLGELVPARVARALVRVAGSGRR